MPYNNTRRAGHIAIIVVGVLTLPLLTIEHAMVGRDHVLHVDCYLFRATSNYVSGSSCEDLIDKINHDNSAPYLVVGSEAAAVADEVYALAAATLILHIVALLCPVVAMLLGRFNAKIPAYLESGTTIAAVASVVFGGLTLDAAQRWSREHDAASPDQSATYASLGGGAYLIVGLPLVATIAKAASHD